MSHIAVTEAVHNNRDNTIELALFQDGQAVDCTTLTRLTLIRRGGAVLLDSDETPDAVSFANSDRVVIAPGALGLPQGRHWAALTVYDDSHPQGIYWQEMMLEVFV